jgi:hypothetical protein
MMACVAARSIDPTPVGLYERLLDDPRPASPHPGTMHGFEPFCSLLWNFSDALLQSLTPEDAFQRKIK